MKFAVYEVPLDTLVKLGLAEEGPTLPEQKWFMVSSTIKFKPPVVLESDPPRL